MPTRFYHIANHALRIAFSIALKLKVEGTENLPPTGPVIVAMNHSSFVDPMLVGAYLSRPVVMMSKIENFELPVFGKLIKWYGAFPIHRGEVDRTALKTALEVLKNGQVLMMAPEGTRSSDGQLQAGHDGLAMLAARTGAMILPFAIAGAKPVAKNLKRLKRTPVHIKVGRAFTLTPSGGKANREELATMTDQIMLRLAELMPPELRGVYRDRVS